VRCALRGAPAVGVRACARVCVSVAVHARVCCKLGCTAYVASYIMLQGGAGGTRECAPFTYSPAARCACGPRHAGVWPRGGALLRLRAEAVRALQRAVARPHLRRALKARGRDGVQPRRVADTSHRVADVARAGNGALAEPYRTVQREYSQYPLDTCTTRVQREYAGQVY
jgi:hypothetical protein